jgi:hypothetical protein
MAYGFVQQSSLQAITRQFAFSSQTAGNGIVQRRLQKHHVGNHSLHGALDFFEAVFLRQQEIVHCDSRCVVNVKHTN